MGSVVGGMEPHHPNSITRMKIYLRNGPNLPHVRHSTHFRNFATCEFFFSFGTVRAWEVQTRFPSHIIRGCYLSLGSTQHSYPFQPVPSVFSCLFPFSPAFSSSSLYFFHVPLRPFKHCTSYVPSLYLPLLLVRGCSSPYFSCVPRSVPP